MKKAKTIVENLAVIGTFGLISFAWVYASLNYPTVFAY